MYMYVYTRTCTCMIYMHVYVRTYFMLAYFFFRCDTVFSRTDTDTQIRILHAVAAKHVFLHIFQTVDISFDEKFSGEVSFSLLRPSCWTRISRSWGVDFVECLTWTYLACKSRCRDTDTDHWPPANNKKVIIAESQWSYAEVCASEREQKIDASSTLSAAQRRYCSHLSLWCSGMRVKYRLAVLHSKCPQRSPSECFAHHSVNADLKALIICSEYRALMRRFSWISS